MAVFTLHLSKFLRFWHIATDGNVEPTGPEIEGGGREQQEEKIGKRREGREEEETKREGREAKEENKKGRRKRR